MFFCRYISDQNSFLEAAAFLVMVLETSFFIVYKIVQMFALKTYLFPSGLKH